MEKLRANQPSLFPNKWSLFIFVAYITLFVNQGILVTATKTSDNKYAYNTIVVVLLTEVTKLVIAVGIYLKDESYKKLFRDLTSNTKVFLLYFVPAALYCLYNNLAFVNLASFDPTTYYLLLQFRVVVTGVIYQFLFKRKLSAWQWFSLILLTFGCLVKNFSHFFQIQVFCSCFAGVYNEYLLKDSAGAVHIMVQNIYMYVDSIVCNLVVLLLVDSGPPGEPLIDEGSGGGGSSAFFAALLEPSVFFVMLNNALCGIVTSMFLKNLNSILKTFAAALELVFTAIICWILFHIPIDLYTAIAISIVSYATYLYSKSPVITTRQISSEPVKYTLLKDLSKEEETTQRSRSNTGDAV